MSKNFTKSVIIICRLDSNRFKKKALKKYKKKSIIEYLVNNILLTKKIKRKDIIISTSDQKNDDELSDIAKKLNIKIFRGSKKNIINRIYNTFKKFKLPNAIITSADNPFFLSEVFESIKDLKNYPIKYTNNLPVGLNLLNCNLNSITRINKRNLSENNENGFYLYFSNTDLFKKKLINFKIKNIFNNTRFTIDYPNDFIFFKKILDLLFKKKYEVSLRNIEKILKDNQHIKSLNFNQQLKYEANLKENTNIFYLNKNNKKTNLPYV